MNEIVNRNSALSATGEELADELKGHGIVTIPSATYEWGGFRYTNARDAIAAAKRGKI